MSRAPLARSCLRARRPAESTPASWPRSMRNEGLSRDYFRQLLHLRGTEPAVKRDDRLLVVRVLQDSKGHLSRPPCELQDRRRWKVTDEASRHPSARTDVGVRCAACEATAATLLLRSGRRCHPLAPQAWPAASGVFRGDLASKHRFVCERLLSMKRKPTCCSSATTCAISSNTPGTATSESHAALSASTPISGGAAGSCCRNHPTDPGTGRSPATGWTTRRPWKRSARRFAASGLGRPLRRSEEGTRRRDRADTSCEPLIGAADPQPWLWPGRDLASRSSSPH